jgi:hypothetical protein
MLERGVYLAPWPLSSVRDVAIMHWEGVDTESGSILSDFDTNSFPLIVRRWVWPSTGEELPEPTGPKFASLSRARCQVIHYGAKS